MQVSIFVPSISMKDINEPNKALCLINTYHVVPKNLDSHRKDCSTQPYEPVHCYVNANVMLNEKTCWKKGDRL